MWNKKKIHGRSVRIRLTTNDIGQMLGVSADYVRQLVHRGDLKFTGDGLQDLNNLLGFRLRRAQNR